MKKSLSVVFALVMLFSFGNIGAIAAEAVDAPAAITQQIDTRIDNKTLSAYYVGSGWAALYGDNNFFNETVVVTNTSNKVIEIKAFNEAGTQVGTTQTLDAKGPGAITSFDFKFNDGRYYFHARFLDSTGGWVNIICDTK